MNFSPNITKTKPAAGKFRHGLHAFTLIEMLVVITIIAILAGIGLPHLKGWGEANTMTAATRQLMDDLAYARLKAISTRSPVYVVFISSNIVDFTGLTAAEQKAVSNLWNGQFTSYALFTPRNVGDQPGRPTTKYLTPWKSLPDKIFIPSRKFVTMPDDTRFLNFVETNSHNRPFATNLFPFPTVNSSQQLSLPYVAFDARGQLISERSERATIPLARGSIFYDPVNGRADAVETPPQNSITNKNWIHIDWLTGRARVEREEIQ